jgi:hypothetical protein
MDLSVVVVSLFCQSYGKGGGDHMILSGVFLDPVANCIMHNTGTVLFI